MHLHIHLCFISKSCIFRCDQWNCPVTRVHYTHDWSCCRHLALLSVAGRGVLGWWTGLYSSVNDLPGRGHLWNHTSSASGAIMELKMYPNYTRKFDGDFMTA